MKKMISILTIMSLAILLTTGAAMACQNGGHSNEADHEHPEGMENCQGHSGAATAGLIAGAVGLPVVVGASYLYSRRQKKE